jgi:hypothetical protein
MSDKELSMAIILFLSKMLFLVRLNTGSWTTTNSERQWFTCCARFKAQPASWVPVVSSLGQQIQFLILALNLKSG